MLNKPIEIGRFGRTHGLKGHLRLYSYTDPDTNIFNYQPWYILNHPESPALNTVFIRAVKDALIVEINGIDDVDAATPFVNQTIFIEQTSLPRTDEDQHYWHELIGMDVINEAGTHLGTVTSMHDNGAHNLMMITPTEGKPFLIPFVDKHIIKVKDNQIIVSWISDAL